MILSKNFVFLDFREFRVKVGGSRNLLGKLIYGENRGVVGGAVEGLKMGCGARKTRAERENFVKVK